MSVHLKISEFDEKDLKNAYDLVMRKENSDAKKSIQFVKRIFENNKFDALVVKDQVNFYYYVVDRGDGIIIYDYDLNTEKILDIAYISEKTKQGRNLVSDAIKDFYKMYFDSIKK